MSAKIVWYVIGASPYASVLCLPFYCCCMLSVSLPSVRQSSVCRGGIVLKWLAHNFQENMAWYSEFVAPCSCDVYGKRCGKVAALHKDTVYCKPYKIDKFTTNAAVYWTFSRWIWVTRSPSCSTCFGTEQSCCRRLIGSHACPADW